MKTETLMLVHRLIGYCNSIEFYLETQKESTFTVHRGWFIGLQTLAKQLEESMKEEGR